MNVIMELMTAAAHLVDGYDAPAANVIINKLFSCFFKMYVIHRTIENTRHTWDLVLTKYFQNE